MSELNSDKGLERALRELAPGPSNLDRDRLMFRAGQVFAPRRNLVWPVITGVLGVTVVILSILLAAQGFHGPVVRILPAPPQHAPMMPPVEKAPPRVEPQSEPALPDYDHETEMPDLRHSPMQDQVLRWGLDALPAVPPESGPEAQLPPITVERPATSPAAKKLYVADWLRFLQ
jgi:hypothetical protein